MQFPVFRSDPKDVHEAGGRYRFAPGKRCTRLPPIDRRHGVFAVMDQATQEAHAKGLGARLATDDEMGQIARVAYWIAPTIIRETPEEKAERIKRGGKNELERMATVEWARRERSGVEAQLGGWDGDRPVINAGKHWLQRTDADKARGVAVNVGWDTDPRVDVTKWIQSPGRAHNAGRLDNPETPQDEKIEGHVDYSQTALYVWDEDKPSDNPAPLNVPRVTAAPTIPATLQRNALIETGGAGYMPDALTPATKDEIYAALAHAAPELNRASLLVLLSQYCLETGAGRSMHRWNLGNFKHVAGDGRQWTMFACSEIIGGKVQWFYPPHAQTWFRAYETLEAGAADYVASMRKRFSRAWAFVVSGDVKGFAIGLLGNPNTKADDYYTANPVAYTAALVQWFTTLDSTIGFDVPSALARLGYDDVRTFQASARLTIDGIAGRNTIGALKVALGRLDANKCPLP